MTTESITEYVERLFPTVRQISDPGLQAKVVAGWERAWKASSWKRIEDCPKSPNLPTDDLVSHVNAVTNCALALADAFEAMGRVTVDRDILITAGLLHDISKLVEFEQRDGKYGLSEVGTKLSHAVYATHIVLDLGLPLEVVHIVHAHTTTSVTRLQSIEAILIYYGDYADTDVLRLAQGLPLAAKARD